MPRPAPTSGIPAESLLWFQKSVCWGMPPHVRSPGGPVPLRRPSAQGRELAARCGDTQKIFRYKQLWIFPRPLQKEAAYWRLNLLGAPGCEKDSRYIPWFVPIQIVRRLLYFQSRMLRQCENGALTAQFSSHRITAESPLKLALYFFGGCIKGRCNWWWTYPSGPWGPPMLQNPTRHSHS